MKIKSIMVATQVAVFLFAVASANAQGGAKGNNGSTRGSVLTAVEQQAANTDANVFKLEDIIDTNTTDSEIDGGTHATGALPLSPEDEAEMRKHARVVKKIHLNKIGLARINAERKRKNQKPLVAGRDVEVAPIGRDVETAAPASSVTAPGAETLEPLSAEDPVVAGGAEPLPDAPGDPLPASVDNSILQYFPPIRDQGSVNSCGQWAGIYYNMTHEVAMLRGWNAKSGGDDYRFTPMFSYNFLQPGNNAGTHSWDGWEIARVHGIPRWSEFYTTSYRTWSTDPADYRNALDARVEGWSLIDNVDTPAALDTLKAHLANGHTAVYYTYIFSWQNKTIANDPATTNDDAYVGKSITYMVNGTSGAHAMTIVGYNDDIWCDINTNGVVEANEKGALRVANSWGGSGLSWIAYQAIVTRNPAATSGGIFYTDNVFFVDVLPAVHEPKVVAKVTINHNLRNQVDMKVGIGDSQPKSATTFTGFQPIEAGGAGIGLTGWRVPRALDWDGDGDKDLLVGDDTGIWRYENTGTTNAPSFAAGVRVKAAGADISLSGNILIALADMTGDGVTDLVAVAGDRTIRIYRNTSASGATPVYAAAVQVQASGGGNFVLPDQRFDVADWNGDGLVDLVMGTYSTDCRVYPNVGTAASALYNLSSTITIESGSYNLYPRVIDMNNDGTLDYLRAINWGDISFWYGPLPSGSVGTRDGIFAVKYANGTTVDVKAVTDGAMLDLADLNGDGVPDLIMGGHAGTGLYVAYGVPEAISTSIESKILTYDGGAYAFSGVAAASQDFTYYLDYTDIVPSIGAAKRWFVQATDSGSNNGNLTIKKLELYYANGGIDRLVGVSTNTPVVANGNTQYAWVDWTMGDAVSLITVAATDATAAEEGPDTGTWTFSRDGDTTNSLAINFVLSGTASNGMDYTVSPASPVTIPAGQVSAVVTLTPVDDSVMDEPVETATLTLIAGTGYAMANADGGAVNITDNDYVAPVVANQGAASLSTTSASVSGKTTAGRDVSAWICWGTMDGGTNSMGNWEHVTSVGAVTQNVTFSRILAGLAGNQTYWYRCVVSNVAGIGWASVATSFSGASEGTWKLTDVPVAAWYDAADASTITSSGGLVTQWRDKSGNNFHVSSGTSPVTGTRTLNGLNVIDFDNNDSLKSAANIAGQPYSYAVIAGVDNSGQDNTIFDGNGAQRSLLRRIAANKLSIYAGAWGPEVAGPSTGNFLASGAFNGATSDVRFNGGTAVVGNPSTGNLSAGITIGNNSSASTAYDHDGVIGEIIIGSGVWSDVDRQKIEGYLAWKWGMVANLPADHPCKGSPPGGSSAIVNMAPTGISETGVTFNASLNASETNYNVYVFYGMSDGGTNASSWASSAYVGSLTNVSANVSYTASGLVGGQPCAYAFCASNTSGTVWASPSWNFVMLGKSDTCQLTVNTAHGTSVPGAVSQQLSNAVVNASIIDSPLLIGTTQYVCTGWIGTGSVTNGSGTSARFTITNNTTLTWIWQTNTVTLYTVLFDAGAHGSRTGGGALTQQVIAGATAIAPVITADEGYTFEGWDAAFSSVSSNMTIHAQYSPIQYTLTYSAGPNGSISGTATQTVDYGTDGDFVTAVADTGYHFVDWSDGSPLQRRSDAGVTEDITVTANFALNVAPVVAYGTGAVAVSESSAVLNGVLTAGQDADAWICWGVSDGGTASTSAWANVVAMGAVTDGVAFSNLVTGLSTNTTYFYRCYAENAYGTDWSDTATTFSGTPVGGGTPWTPADIDTTAWYDAADASTVLANTTSVTNWQDKSGNGYHATQGTDTARPKTGTRSLNGLNVLDFDGGTDWLNIVTKWQPGASNVTIIGVVDIDDTSSPQRLLNGTVGAATRYGLSPYMHDNIKNTLCFIASASYLPVGHDTGSTGVTGQQIIGGYKTGSTQGVGRNGQLTHITNSSGGTVSTLTTLNIGAYNNGASDFLNGAVGELIVLQHYSLTDRQKIEGYLAWKWGLAANLPVGHPYKSAPPGGAGAIANLAPTAISDSAATLNAGLVASGTNYDVTVYYGTSDGGTNAAAWGTSAAVGSWTNAATNISYAVSGLTAGQTYHYTFMASNAAGAELASPSWTFKTTGTALQLTVNHSVPYAWLGNWSWTNGYESAVLDDPDGDGFTTWQEYWSGTDPQNSNSFLRIDSVTFEGGNVVIKWQHSAVDTGLPALTIQTTTNLQLGSWVYTGQKSPVNGTNSWSGTALPQQLFYRLAVTNAP